MYIIQLLKNGGDSFSREGLLNVGAFIIALLCALILHEIAHGLVALWFGDTTARDYGRLSLNPARHFDWMGLAMMLLCGFGWAKPVPVNTSNFKNKKLGMICVSLAGVVTNLIVAFLFAGVSALAYSSLGYQIYQTSYYLWWFVVMLGELGTMLNISFACFNILPLYPLDGYRLLSCYIPQDNAFLTFLRRYSTYILLGFIVLGYVFPAISPLSRFINWGQTTLGGAFESFWRLFIK